MKNICLVTCVTLTAFSTAALAIDRDAKLIDTFQVDLQELDDADAYGASIWGERPFEATDWSVLLGVGIGRLAPNDPTPKMDTYRLAVGLVYYLTPVTSVSAVGQYEQFNQQGDDQDVKSGILSFKQRFAPADAAVSPYALGKVTFRERSTFSDDSVTDDSFSEYLLQIGGGAELAVNETFSMTFDVGYVIADPSNDNTEDLDGWVGTIGMRYYFDGSFYTDLER